MAAGRRHTGLSVLAWLVGIGLLAGCAAPSAQRGDGAHRDCRPGGVWRVRAGDTLGGIAQRCRVSLRRLARHNQIDPPYMIRIGQRIRIPARHAVEKSPPRDRKRAIRQTIVLKPPVQAPSRWLDDGKGRHARFYMIAIGTPVGAAAAGQVAAVTELPFYGRVVLIAHADGFMTVYAHLFKIKVRRGQRVKTGQSIGLSGVNPQTGEPGLYFELRRGKRQLDLRRWRQWAE